MIEAREKCDLVTDKLEALLTLQELRTRIQLLVEYIHDVEADAARTSSNRPSDYNTDINKVDVPASKVLWFLNEEHDPMAYDTFINAKRKLKELKKAEKGAQDGEAVREGQS